MKSSLYFILCFSGPSFEPFEFLFFFSSLWLLFGALQAIEHFYIIEYAPIDSINRFLWLWLIFFVFSFFSCLFSVQHIRESPNKSMNTRIYSYALSQHLIFSLSLILSFLNFLIFAGLLSELNIRNKFILYFVFHRFECDCYRHVIVQISSFSHSFFVFL